MNNIIKHVKPSKKSRYQQGYINPQSCKKLFESVKNQPIIYRSSYEKKFMVWCENSPIVKVWGSECIEIPYIMNNKPHRYYPDYVLELNDGRKILVEIKPKSQTIKPTNMNCYAWEQWIKNQHKWTAAKQWCDRNGLEFWILTEDTINKLY